MECACSYSSLLPLTSLSPPPFPSKLKLLRIKHLSCFESQKPNLFVRSGLGSEENSNMGYPVTPNKFFQEEVIGAEYGEGFETFRPDGPLKVDVDFLNDRLQTSLLQRIRYAMKPDEAYGLIFSWENVLADTSSVKLKTWKQLASEEGRDIPKDRTLQRNMLYGSADHVLHKLSEPMEGLKEWLSAVSTARIPCAVVSSLDRTNMVEVLLRMGLYKYFQAIVTEEDGMESMAHRFLSAAVKLDRKPSMCVVFEDDPRGITAAHNCTMKAAALIGAHPAYDLVQADLAVSTFNELSVINLRRLFANSGATFMDMEKQMTGKAPQKRKFRVDTIF
ncbi:5-amino-6-(5-phospho-D-ribitylamino)uracil phosphatase, chloroplastic isoform X1 [Daucus carota subsp. sativus]|uniref:5-amino-6-(5-phospho-D-ribitylamino)uracil phosphatase, chloroplastic isoform X1 n=1 Tax=Daucus carota subsp. sativus TaxID=79200 RepID=UPI003082C7DE